VVDRLEPPSEDRRSRGDRGGDWRYRPGLSELVQTQVSHATNKLVSAFEPASHQGPLLVHVVAPGTFFSGHTYAPYYVVPNSRVTQPSIAAKSALASGSHTNEALSYAWVRSHGGYAASPQIVRLELSSTAGPILINQITPIVVSTRKLLKGWYVASPGCGAAPV
jgi:hypothetical protein